MALPARLWKLAQLLVPLIEINRANPGGVFGEKTLDSATGEQTVTKGWGGWGAYRESNPQDLSETARWIRFFTGSTTYDINLDRQAYFKNSKITGDLSRLKSALTTSTSKNENRRSSQIIRAIEAIERQSFTEE